MAECSLVSADADDVHPEEASHEAHWEEKDRDHSENENGFAIVILKGFHQLDVLNRM